MFWVQRWNGAEYFDLFIADGVAIQPSGSLHGEKSYNLKHVVLDHIADGPGGVVKLTPPFDPEFFGHRDLHTLDVIPIPDRFQKTIGEAKEQQIEDCLFTEVMVDPKDLRFRKHRTKCGIQLLGRRKIVSKGLLDNDSRILDAVRLCERLYDACEQTGWNRQIVRRTSGRAKSFLQKVEGRWFLIIAPDIAKQLQQLGQGFLIDLGSLLLNAVAHALLEMFVGASRPGNANHGYIQVTMLDHMIKRREYFLVSQVPHGYEKNQSIGWRCIFRALSYSTSLSEIRHECLLVLKGTLVPFKSGSPTFDPD